MASDSIASHRIALNCTDRLIRSLVSLRSSLNGNRELTFIHPNAFANLKNLVKL